MGNFDRFNPDANPLVRKQLEEKGLRPAPGVPTENKKVKGARKITKHGITFDSRLELLCWEQLKAAGIEFDFQKKFILQPTFKYNGDTVLSIRMIVDFYLPKQHIIIDTKGWQTVDNKIKWKMLKYSFATAVATVVLGTPRIFLPSKQDEVLDLVMKIKHNQI